MVLTFTLTRSGARRCAFRKFVRGSPTANPHLPGDMGPGAPRLRGVLKKWYSTNKTILLAEWLAYVLPAGGGIFDVRQQALSLSRDAGAPGGTPATIID